LRGQPSKIDRVAQCFRSLGAFPGCDAARVVRMYIRFVVGSDDEDHRQLTGVITKARLLRDDGGLEQHQITSLEEAYVWLNEHLPRPPFSTSGWGREAVSWFKDDAKLPIKNVGDCLTSGGARGCCSRFEIENAGKNPLRRRLSSRGQRMEASIDKWPLKSVVGQTAKNSPRAYVFRLAPELGHCSTRSALHTQKKDRLRCHKRPKSREETPKEGSDSGMGLGVATA
jgi:hypothetical protein